MPALFPRTLPNYGQADMTVMLGDHIYVMEFKVVDGETVEGNPALEQILQRKYADKYLGDPNKTLHDVGFVFSRSPRGLIKADWK